MGGGGAEEVKEERGRKCARACAVGGGLPEAPSLRHLLLQIPLLPLLPRHPFVVGGEAENGPRPLVYEAHTQ